MYCPKCAVHNDFNAKYCRSCGADISLVREAVYGQLAERLAAAEGGAVQPRQGGHEQQPTLDNAVRKVFMGVAFFLIAFTMRFWADSGDNWWYWLFLPAFGLLGTGVGEYLRVKEERRRVVPPAFVPAQGAVPAPAQAASLPPRDTGEMVRPPSVTEGTTRHLGVPVESRPKDA